MADTYGYLSPYFEGSYFSDYWLPGIPLVPWTLVIDLETMKVIAADEPFMEGSICVTPEEILSAVTQANID